jgi:hypothetical protein
MLGIKQSSQIAYEEMMYKIMCYNCQRSVKHILICTMNIELKIYLQILLVCELILFWFSYIDLHL